MNRQFKMMWICRIAAQIMFNKGTRWGANPGFFTKMSDDMTDGEDTARVRLLQKGGKDSGVSQSLLWVSLFLRKSLKDGESPKANRIVLNADGFPRTGPWGLQ
jgi:hypothetical protein